MSSASGGAAAQGGFSFQNRVAAWVAVRIFAEQAAQPPWGLPADASFEYLRCETDQSVDDLLVGITGDRFALAQIKRQITLEVGEGSEFASVIDQMVRQFLRVKAAAGTTPWERPLDAQRDRLLLITGPETSASVRVHLRSVLDRLRSLTPGQPLIAAAGNSGEKHALEVALEHVGRSWQRWTGAAPTEGEIRTLLGLIRIEKLDVETGGTDELSAKELLRAAVLADQTQADLAWNTLLRVCADLAQHRSGADRAELARRLRDAGIHLRAPASYQADIDRLRRFSGQMVDLLKRNATIRVGATEVKISRPVIEALSEAVGPDPLVVVGEPGAGKSIALHDLVQAIASDGGDAILFPVDRLSAHSLGTLREELGLAHDLLDLLGHWRTTHPVLIIDGLDSARSERAAQTFRDLISQVACLDGWSIVASIRKYDLRRGHELRRLFLGSAPTAFVDLEFAGLRHVNIPLLDAGELVQVALQSPDLGRAVVGASSELMKLLRVPFNLSLVAELLTQGVAVQELTPIRTQVELLDRYWVWRVMRSDGFGDAREIVVRRAAAQMVGDRTLRARRQQVVDEPSTSPFLDQVLSANILVEWQSSVAALPTHHFVAFSHPILFDYAVARLLLWDADELVHRLSAEPDLVLVIRPSLLLRLQQAWFEDPTRAGFWALLFALARAPGVPSIATVVGPQVTAELASTLADLSPLRSALDSGDSAELEAALESLRHLVCALVLLREVDRERLVGPTAGPWAELLEGLSTSLRPGTAQATRILLNLLCERPASLLPAQRDALGTAARRVLHFAWNQETRDPWLVMSGLKGVCRLYESDAVASSALLRQALDEGHLASFGYEELHWVADEISTLLPLDPNLVEGIYRAAFTYQETSKEPTAMSSSQIFSLSSNRRQDYEMALYTLVGVYPRFLQEASVHATRALVAALDFYAARRHRVSQAREEAFQFLGYQACIRSDVSQIWDSWPYDQDQAFQLLDAFTKHLATLAQDSQRSGQREEILLRVAEDNSLAVVWRRLLMAGADHPETLGVEMRELAWASPILRGDDTTGPARDFLQAIFPILAPEERELVEQALLALPSHFDGQSVEIGERRRDRLLARLDASALVTDEARRLRIELEAQGVLPPLDDEVTLGRLTVQPWGERNEFERRGVPDTEPNRSLRALEEPVRLFAERHANSPPDAAQIESIIPAVTALHQTLGSPAAKEAHETVLKYAWARLAAACQAIACSSVLTCEADNGHVVRSALLAASRCPDPEPETRLDPSFEDRPHWGSPAARVDAARGLVLLARFSGCADEAVQARVQELAEDTVPAVRLQIARSLWVLHQAAPPVMWQLLGRFCGKESSRGVLQGVSDSLVSLAGPYGEHVSGLAKAMLDRVREGPGHREVRDRCIDLLTQLYVVQDGPTARDVLESLAKTPGENSQDVSAVARRLRLSLTREPGPPHARAVGLFQNLVAASTDRYGELLSIRPENWSPEQRAEAEGLLHLADELAQQLFFASGAFAEKQESTGSGDRRLSLDEKHRFLSELGPCVSRLAELGHPHLVHSLVETLESLVAAGPADVFQRLAGVVKAGARSGYQYEPLAQRLIVAIVERYLAELRFLLQENEDFRRCLLEILDVFVDAGWPDASRLTYRLDEIFR